MKTWDVKTKKIAIPLGLVGAIGFLAATGCGDNAVALDPPSTGSEIIGAILGGLANSTESTGVQARVKTLDRTPFFFHSLFSWLQGVSYAGSCPTFASFLARTGGTSCSALVGQRPYSACGFGTSLAIWDNGGETLDFSTSCPTTNAGLNSQNVVRYFQPGTTRLNSNNETVTLDTTVASTTSGWDSTVIVPGNGIRIAYAANFSVSGIRDISIDGMNVSAVRSGSPRYNFTISTITSAFRISGLSGTRTIAAGSGGGIATIQDNQVAATGNARITVPLVYTGAGASCCLPIGGTIATQYAGGKTGVESLAFGPGCGKATLTNVDGSTVVMNLVNCF